jgi:hypothetical protein
MAYSATSEAVPFLHKNTDFTSRPVVEILRVLLLDGHLCRTEVGASNAWLPVRLAIDSKLKAIK